jgi:hypothetical protein
MDQDKALRILKALAEGIDPQSGKVFSPDSPYQQADVVRALYTAMGVLKAGPAETAKTRATPGNAGKPWTQEEDERLLRAFDSGQTLEALAQSHGRSRLGIEVRLAKFGKISAPTKALPSARPQVREPERAYAR